MESLWISGVYVCVKVRLAVIMSLLDSVRLCLAGGQISKLEKLDVWGIEPLDSTGHLSTPSNRNKLQLGMNTTNMYLSTVNDICMSVLNTHCVSRG